MKFKEKASALALCTVLLGTSLVPVSAAQDEIIGKDRFETAAKVADRLGNYNTAILVNSDKSLADGLSASSLAGKENAPILLVHKDNIPQSTMDRLKKVKRVYIIGGKAAISDNVTNKLSGKQVIRIEGRDRIDTSVKVAKLIGNYDNAFLVNGFKGEADAMSVAALAAREKSPILLTNGKVSTHKDNSRVRYFAIGGSSVVSPNIIGKHWAARIGGKDRYETNRLVMERFYPNSKTVYYTKGDKLVDALTVSSLAKNNGVVLVSPKSDNSILKDKNIIQVGGMNFKVDPNENVNPEPVDPKPDKPVNPDKPVDPKPDNSNQDINSEAYQTEFRNEFYKLVNDYRVSKGLNTLSPHPLQEKMTYLKSKHMVDLNYFDHFYDDSQTQYYKDKWRNNGTDPHIMIHDIYPEIFEGTGSEYGQEIIAGVIGSYGKSAKGLAREAFESWQKSSGHEQSMTDDWDKYMGVSIYSGNGVIYATGAFTWK